MITATRPLLRPAGSRLTGDEYRAMIASGELTDDDRVELLEGQVVTKMPRNPPHDFAVDRLQELLFRMTLPGYFVKGQTAVAIDDSQPEPDVCVIRGVRSDFIARHPGPESIAFVVEVADSSLARDRGAKARIYANAGVPVYWIVNIPDLLVEVYTNPTGPDANPHYRHTSDQLNGQLAVVLDGVTVGAVAVEDLLP